MQRTWVWFPAHMSGSVQSPVTPTPEDWTLVASICICVCMLPPRPRGSHAPALTCTCIHMHPCSHAPALKCIDTSTYMSHTRPHAYISRNENNSLKTVHPPDNLMGIMGDRIPNSQVGEEEWKTRRWGNVNSSHSFWTGRSGREWSWRSQPYKGARGGAWQRFEVIRH